MIKKILLVGSSGFIGTAIKQLLLTNGHKVICCDIDDTNSVKDYFAFKDYTNFLLNISKHRFDFVINAGGNGNVQNSIFNPKFDFVCVHWYAPPNVDSFLKQIDAIYAKYQKPIWVTEFAVADWAGKYPGGYDVNLVQEFMKGACAGLESRDFVERYTWKTRTLADTNLGTSSLFNDDGTLTALGAIYAAL